MFLSWTRSITSESGQIVHLEMQEASVPGAPPSLPFSFGSLGLLSLPEMF